MNYQERILNTIKGNTVDFLPFVPRMDLWYKSNKINGTLPYKYKNYSLKEITSDLGAGYHSVVPDFRNFIDKKAQLCRDSESMI